MDKKIIIIGAGIAGLSAGCYLRMSGYDTEIIEMHDLPGGLCTSWKKKGFTVDGCIHWLVGSGPSDRFHRLWSELIDMGKVEFIDFDEYMVVEDRDGKQIHVFADMDRLEAEMMEKAPEDGELIREFIGAARRLMKMDLPLDKPQELYSFLDGIKMMGKVAPYMGLLKKWSGISGKDLSSKCRNPLLARTFESMFIPGMSAIFLIFIVIWMHRKSAGYPVGGSLKFAGLIEKRYRELGGTVRYGSRVREIRVTDNSARGVVLDNGETCSADAVLSAADGYGTIFEMLKGKYVNDRVLGFYRHYEVFPSYLQVSLGISKKFDGMPHSLVIEPERPLRVDDITVCASLGFRIFNFDRTLSPAGKTLVSVMLPTGNYKYWNGLRKENMKKYREEKKRVADSVISEFCRRSGIKKSAVVMTDVSTPATVIRYTGNWKGSFEGWLLSPKMGFKQMKKTLPGLGGFSMAGHWVEPGGGVPSAMLSGRNAAQLICSSDGREFRSTMG